MTWPPATRVCLRLVGGKQRGRGCGVALTAPVFKAPVEAAAWGRRQSMRPLDLHSPYCMLAGERASARCPC